MQQMDRIDAGIPFGNFPMSDVMGDYIASVTDTEEFSAGIDLPCLGMRFCKKGLCVINDNLPVELLHQMFGVNAELLIDHAWGYEPCTIAQIRAYKPQSSSLGCGQVLPCPYTADKARIVVQEMIDGISLELVEKRLVTDQLVLTVGYDIENLTRPEIRKVYKGPVTTDRYGRRVPKHAHGTWNLPRATSSSSELLEAMAALYDKIVNPALLIRRMSLSACHVVNEKMAKEREQKETFEQLDLFTDYAKKEAKEKEEQKKRERERRMQEALLTIKKKYGKNAVLRGMNFEEGATAKERNGQIGGHQA